MEVKIITGDKVTFVVIDQRGESRDYEAYSLETRDNLTNRVIWTEGIRRDRSAMRPEWRKLIDPVLEQLKKAK